MFMEDVSPFFSLQGFAVDATLGGSPVTGILDKGYSEPLAGMSGLAPTFTLPTSQTAGARNGTVLVVAGVTYKVAGPPEPDGTGVTVLKLEEQ